MAKDIIKKKVGELYGRPIVISNPDAVTKIEYLLDEGALKERNKQGVLENLDKNGGGNSGTSFDYYKVYGPLTEEMRQALNYGMLVKNYTKASNASVDSICRPSQIAPVYAESSTTYAVAVAKDRIFTDYDLAKDFYEKYNIDKDSLQKYSMTKEEFENMKLSVCKLTTGINNEYGPIFEKMKEELLKGHIDTIHLGYSRIEVDGNALNTFNILRHEPTQTFDAPDGEVIVLGAKTGEYSNGYYIFVKQTDGNYGVYQTSKTSTNANLLYYTNPSISGGYYTGYNSSLVTFKDARVEVKIDSTSSGSFRNGYARIVVQIPGIEEKYWIKTYKPYKWYPKNGLFIITDVPQQDVNGNKINGDITFQIGRDNHNVEDPNRQYMSIKQDYIILADYPYRAYVFGNNGEYLKRE